MKWENIYWFPTLGTMKQAILILKCSFGVSEWTLPRIREDLIEERAFKLTGGIDVNLVRLEIGIPLLFLNNTCSFI